MLPNNKPIVYKILTLTGQNNYRGIAKRCKGRERIKEHLGKIPGAKVQIEQMSSIDKARKKETNIR